MERTLLEQYEVQVDLIKKEQEKLYFIAKKYYDSKYPKLKGGNYYAIVIEKHNKTEYLFAYQKKDYYLTKIEAKWYPNGDEPFRWGDNRIENEFHFHFQTQTIKTSGISKFYDSEPFFYLTMDMSAPTQCYILATDQNLSNVLKENGMKPNTHLTKANLLKLMNKMIERGCLEERKI